MKRFGLFLGIFILLGCQSPVDFPLKKLEGRWIERGKKLFFFEEWHELKPGEWAGFSYVLPRKELNRTKRIRVFRVVSINQQWVYIERNEQHYDTLLLQSSTAPNVFVFHKEGREESFRKDPAGWSHTSVFSNNSTNHLLEKYQPAQLKEEIPYSLVK